MEGRAAAQQPVACTSRHSSACFAALFTIGLILGDTV